MDPKRIDELARRLAAVLPEGINDLRTDMERNFRAVLQGTLARMDVVTREEFDVQAGVLARTREKVEQLLQRLEELEKALAKSSGGTRAAGKKTGGTGAARKKKRPESPG
jgi:BMFP domain-containing protein YqiC